jgi:hypothetical protein
MSFSDGSAWQWGNGLRQKNAVRFQARGWRGSACLTCSSATNMLAATPLNILQSTGLVGAAIALVLLHCRTPIGSQLPARGATCTMMR